MHPHPHVTEWEPTLGELARRLDHVDSSLHSIHSGMVNSDLYKAHREHHEGEIRQIHRRLDQMDADRLWTRRLLISVLFTAIASLITQAATGDIFH